MTRMLGRDTPSIGFGSGSEAVALETVMSCIKAAEASGRGRSRTLPNKEEADHLFPE
jgi:hypothetical protein